MRRRNIWTTKHRHGSCSLRSFAGPRLRRSRVFSKRTFPIDNLVFLESVALVAFFYSYPLQVLNLTALVVAVSTVWGYFSIRGELRNSLRIRFFAASSRAISKVATAALIFLIAMYAAVSIGRGNFFVPQNYFNGFFDWSSGIVANFYPGIPLDGSFGDFAQAVAQEQLKNNATFESLPADQQSQVLAASTAQIAGSFTPTPSATEPTREVFYSYFIAMASKLQGQFGNGFIFVWGLILFLILRTIAILAVWIAQFVTLVFYEFFLAIGFVAISEESESRELIGLT